MADVPPRPVVPNVLASRYASLEMNEIWSPEHKVVMERRLWVEILRAQRDAGMDVPDEAVAAYEAVVDDVDLASIEARERVSRHDVKARIEEFCALAGHEFIHRGLTSRDITENVEQAQVRAALVLVRDRLVATLARLCTLADRYADLVMTGRTHNVAAQATTLGKRWATIGTETLAALERLDALLERYALRGLKGPVGTQQDLADLLAGVAGDTPPDVPAAVAEIERRVAAHLGFERVAASVGQVYPRSLDLDVVATLVGAAAPLGNAALLVRLMAGHELATEGFAAGQVGSSAMPHKMNPRSSERVTGLVTVLRGHLTMAAALAGDQWNEGDVSCSVVRRVVLPDAFFALDGAIETTLEVLDNFGAHAAPIAAELADHLPFLATTRLLTAATAAGCGREEAHAVIREHALAATSARREGDSAAGAALLDRIAADARLGLSSEAVHAVVDDPASFTGLARRQVDDFVAAAKAVIDARPSAAAYEPSPTL
ncbi:MAG TPA: adenylosuccinate lyase [Acidimicrobiaceae bacterium]|nr:adenylosuccinate lyase [Acidimicrobiaceae bacterium]HCB37773.1 adenylosuccinate lyase [Acidimicrobiaceae bacterium]